MISIAGKIPLQNIREGEILHNSKVLKTTQKFNFSKESSLRQRFPLENESWCNCCINAERDVNLK